MSVRLRASRRVVQSFRLHRHRLSRRLPAGSLLEAGACGVEDTPPTSALVALHARISHFDVGAVARAVTRDRTLISSWSVRQAPLLFPAAHAAAFTCGLLPDGEDGLRHLLRRSADDLERAAIKPADALERVADGLAAALDGRVLSKAALSEELNRLVPESLRFWCRRCQARHVPEPLIRAAALRGMLCFTSAPGEPATFARLDQWLGRPLDRDPEAAAADLVRRYLGAYGPSTPLDFARWAGIEPGDAQRRWQLVQGRLVEVDFDGRRAWLHGDDIATFESPPMAMGTRLLPPYDQFLHQQDRDVLLPDAAFQRRVWRQTGNPGVVLVQGEIAGVWRSERKGERLAVRVDAFRPTSGPVRSAIAAEARTLAPLRDCVSVTVQFSR